KNTRSIHHYAASWVSSSFSLKVKIKRFLPERLLIWISAIKRKIRK
ncbi:MAG: glycosyl transferase, partial [bacterium]|nr:glycosyl transferase [bacterium]